jgi:glycosyltransferase involved in cell wall biosynthesis
MTEPEVSVVIPTRNRWPMLSTHALPSALAQEDVDLEIVVVDDASGDGTAARVAELGDPRVRVVRNETNRRLPASRNVGAEEARGTWLAFLDDDDLWSPRKLRAQLDVAQASGA